MWPGGCRAKGVGGGARVTVVGLDRLAYRLEDFSTGHADATIDQVAGQPFDQVLLVFDDQYLFFQSKLPICAGRYQMYLQL